MFVDVEEKIKRKNKLLFNRDSTSLQELKQLIEHQKHRTIVMWVLDCAQKPLSQFEEKYPTEKRPRITLETSTSWAQGKIKMPVAKKAILDTHKLAGTLDDPIYSSFCRAIGHAGATVHAETHALGLVFYELTAIVLMHDKVNYSTSVQARIQEYTQKLSYWEKHIDELDSTWAHFLLDDSKPNKEKLLSLKRSELNNLEENDDSKI